MKTLLVITLSVLLLKGGQCDSNAEFLDTTSFDESVGERDSTSQDINEDMSQDAPLDVQNAIKDDNGAETTNAQGINLKYNAGKGLVITLTPDGHVRDGNGVTYTRWGKTTCPQGAKKIYSGLAAGGWFNQKGNGANYLCMPPDPQYLSTTTPPWPSLLYGAEYKTNNKIFSGQTYNYNVPCVVCQSPRINKLMIPAKVSCPPSWTREYYGYLMTSHQNHYQTILYECVDHVPDVVPGSGANRGGALFYFVMQAECNLGLPCGPYAARKAVTCAICTK